MILTPPFHSTDSRTLTEGRQGDLLGQRRPGGLLHHRPSPVPASTTANDRPPTGPSNDTSDAIDTTDGAEGGREEREGAERGGDREEEPNCPVQ